MSRYKKNLFLLLSLLIWPLQSQSRDQFGDCATSSIRCNGHSWNIAYPFRLSGAPAHCGHPSFELRCTGNDSVLEITMAGKAYGVSSIRYNTQFIGVSNMEYAHNSCPRAFHNTTVDFSLFNYSDNGVNMTVFYNCSPPRSSSLRDANNVIPCLSNATSNLQSYFSLPNDDATVPAAELYDNCSSIVLIPMFRDVTELFLNGRLDFLGVLQDGFGLNWIAGNGWCGECVDSGGVCGNNPNSPNMPTCICGNGKVTNGTCPAGTYGPPECLYSDYFNYFISCICGLLCSAGPLLSNFGQ